MKSFCGYVENSLLRGVIHKQAPEKFIRPKQIPLIFINLVPVIPCLPAGKYLTSVALFNFLFAIELFRISLLYKLPLPQLQSNFPTKQTSQSIRKERARWK